MIRKTLKMLLIGGVALGGAGFLFLGTDFPGYLGSVASSVRERVADQIPVELELRRAEDLIRQIDPQIQSCKRDLARAEVELEDLQSSVVHLEEVVAAEAKKLRVGANLLREARDHGVHLASDFSAERRVSADLGRTKDSYVNNVAILDTKRALIERQTRAVGAAKDRLAAVRYERAALEDQVRALKTQRMQVEALAATSDRFDFDSTALSEAKEVIAGVRKRLDVAQRMLENDMAFAGEPVDVPLAARDVLGEIDELFGAREALAPSAGDVALPATR